MFSRFRPSAAMVVACIALFVALGGGAYALSGSNTVQSDDLGPGAQVKAADVAENAVNGSDVKDGSLSLADLSAGSRPHKLEFSAPTGTPETPIARIGHLQLSAECFSTPAVFLYLKNLTNVAGTMNVLLTNQGASNGPVALDASGQFLGGGDEVTVDRNDDTLKRVLASGNFDRVEGQVVFQTPGRVTTINFHAFTTTNGGSRCEFYGTAVTSNLS
jgi:hypothetical protein